jgi:hypothetical protein
VCCLPAYISWCLQDCLAALPCRTSFITLVADYNIHLKGAFNPPMWNNRELDLYMVSQGLRYNIIIIGMLPNALKFCTAAMVSSSHLVAPAVSSCTGKHLKH